MLLRASAFVAALVLAPVIASAQQPCTGDARHVVNELYRHILERSADRGSDQWVRQLNSGSATVKEIVRQIVMSSEHSQRFVPTGSGEANERAVRNLYRHILGRDPDENGLRAHAQGLQTSGLAGVVDNMLNSAEYQQAYGDNGVPGSPGLRFCGQGQQSSTRGSTGTDDMRFRTMDSDNDGRITRGEWRGSRPSFNVHDWNRDGVLSGDEVRAAARRPASDINERDFDPNDDSFDSWTASSFATIDHNRDNRISEAEWHHGYEVFRRVDRNGDGFLSRQEFLASDMDDDREDSFDNLDANGDGRVTRDEWHGSADAFNLLDRNDNNVLTRAEVIGNPRAGGDRFSSLDMNRDDRLTLEEWHWSRRSFNQQDANGDGVITRREFNGGAVPTTGR